MVVLGQDSGTGSGTAAVEKIIQDSAREVELLANFLADPRLVRASVLRPEHFGYAKNRAVFQAMRNLQEDTAFSVLEVSRELSRLGAEPDTNFLFRVKSLQPDAAPDPVHVREISGKIIEAAARVSSIQRAKEALRSLEDPSIDYPAALKDLAGIVVAGEREVVSNTSPDIKDIINGDRSNVFGRRFYTNLGPLDQATRGMRQGQVWNINAPYKSYKTRWILNIVIGVLLRGGSVSIQTLEDNAGALMEKLVALLTCMNEQDVEMYFEDDWEDLEKRDRFKAQAKPAIDNAMDWLSSKPLRIYDHRHNVHDWKTLRYRIMADKMQYNTDLVVVDHINQFSDDNEVLGEIYRSSVTSAQEAQVCFLGLSQQSNQSILQGTTRNMLATRGTGTAGMTVHFGLEVKYNPNRDEARLVVDQAYLASLKRAHITDHGLVEGDLIKEVGLWLKILRRGSPVKMWGHFEPTSGRLIMVRSDRGDPTDEFYGSATHWDWEN
jgi:replicative DNA helicase